MRFLVAIFAFLGSIFPVQTSKTDQNCQYLVHLGDSTSIPITKSLKTGYERFGFKNVTVDATNGGSIWYPTGYSGVEKVRRYKKPGTCWVIALGTNDSASSSSQFWNQRIDSIMAVIGDDPVMWVNVWMFSRSRPTYNVFVATAWNQLLMKKHFIFPNMVIYDWATTARTHPEWFYDGIHYTAEGSKQRSYYITAIASLLLH